MNKLISATILGTIIFLAPTSGFAISCTQQSQSCKTWASSQGAQAGSYAAKCTREISACISRCKKGQKYFIGVYAGSGGGQQYPIDECN